MDLTGKKAIKALRTARKDLVNFHKASSPAICLVKPPGKKYVFKQ
jgi:hypothetical protein